uniref:Uncharacterized protein n=1 Tax=Zea mays TaxID=4577 RepID=C4J2F8_MAIZE|nr:unknown [Zea mays]
MYTSLRTKLQERKGKKIPATIHKSPQTTIGRR